jgi:hypothetical protein
MSLLRWVLFFYLINRSRIIDFLIGMKPLLIPTSVPTNILAPAQVVAAPAQVVTAPAQIVAAPATVITTIPSSSTKCQSQRSCCSKANIDDDNDSQDEYTHQIDPATIRLIRDVLKQSEQGKGQNETIENDNGVICVRNRKTQSGKREQSPFRRI